MIEIILIAGIALLIIGTRQFLKKDKKELTPEQDLPTGTWAKIPEVMPEPVKVVKAIGKTEKATGSKAEPAKKKGRPKKSQ